ncbi:anti-sigma factor, partial [Planktotalea sp.]|uniref:anti-sigma factor n=1 Tax=Planktotalea sp. TaxID=2029877 RepID=UPI0032988601
DPRVAAELEALFELNTDLRGAFDELLAEPVPETLSLAPSSITPEPETTPALAAANTNRAPWRSLAAMLALGLLLGAGGMWASRTQVEPVQVAAARSWLGEVAEYHQIYARQTRHLVEVPASEQDHIEKWLSKEVGFDFKVPDLSAAGFTFQGARLLVAAGKPVAQLMYTDANGAVIALCGLLNGSGTPAGTALRAFGDVHMATWKSETGSFAIVGDAPEQLEDLAELATPLI